MALRVTHAPGNTDPPFAFVGESGNAKQHAKQEAGTRQNRIEQDDTNNTHQKPWSLT